MSIADITMAILSHHPVQLLATTVLVVHLARAVLGRPVRKARKPAGPPGAARFRSAGAPAVHQHHRAGACETLGEGDGAMALANPHEIGNEPRTPKLLAVCC